MIVLSFGKVEGEKLNGSVYTIGGIRSFYFVTRTMRLLASAASYRRILSSYLTNIR